MARYIFRLVGDELTDTYPWAVIDTRTGKEHNRYNLRAVADQTADRLNTEYVLANVSDQGRFGCFNVYPTRDAALADQERANGPEWVGWGPYVPMLFADYLDAERDHWLTGEPREITREEWTDMLEVLPPMKWIMEPGYNSFLMSEMTSGPYTSQYVKVGERYFTKTVDAYDRSTWIQPDHA